MTLSLIIFAAFVSRTCRVRNTISYLNTDVKQHWAKIVLRWETAWELVVLVNKPKPGFIAGAYK